jgi:DNA-binding transcriptional LysR family regulator
MFDMPRNLDIASLRAFLAVIDLGGVTRAANQLNLTQSAVSLQIKRLEAVLDQPLFARNGRGMVPTTQGEQLIAHARRVLAANDETLSQMRTLDFSGDITLGTPDDLLYPRVPCAMRDFARSHPQVKVRLRTAQTATLKEEFAGGAIDVILTTEAQVGTGGEPLLSEPLVWIGAHGGRAWQKRPLPLGTVANCIFNKPAIASLTASAFDWQLEVDNVSNTAVEASIAADMIVRLQMRSTVDPQFEIIDHRGQLPALPNFYISMYVARGPRHRLTEGFAGCLRAAFAEDNLAAAQ